MCTHRAGEHGIKVREMILWGGGRDCFYRCKLGTILEPLELRRFDRPQVFGWTSLCPRPDGCLRRRLPRHTPNCLKLFY